jgi:hypothetical protein
MTFNTDDRHIVVGPLCWPPAAGSNEHDEAASYFIIATCDERQQFRCDAVHANAEGRLDILMMLAQRQPALVISVVEDELEMARLCEVLWPGKWVSRLRRAVARERRELTQH